MLQAQKVVTHHKQQVATVVAQAVLAVVQTKMTVVVMTVVRLAAAVEVEYFLVSVVLLTEVTAV